MTSERRETDASAGLLARVKARLGPAQSDSKTTERGQDHRRAGQTPIDELVDRCEASVLGVVRSVTVQPRANMPALIAEIYDGSKALNLIFLGRRRIGGVTEGTCLSARGRVTYQQGIPTIFNPAYEIRPDGER